MFSLIMHHSPGRKVSSKELMEGVLIKLKLLGTKGERVLELLQQVDKTKFLDEEDVSTTETSIKMNNETVRNHSVEGTPIPKLSETTVETIAQTVTGDNRQSSTNTTPPPKKGKHIFIFK